jgi:hypothetical protein
MVVFVVVTVEVEFTVVTVVVEFSVVDGGVAVVLTVEELVVVTVVLTVVLTVVEFVVITVVLTVVEFVETTFEKKLTSSALEPLHWISLPLSP